MLFLFNRGTQSFLMFKNQLCYDFSFLSLILNFVEKYSSKLKFQTESFHSLCQLQEAKGRRTIIRRAPKV